MPKLKEINQEHARLVKGASLASILVAISLIAMKLFAWFMTGSVSLLASLLDSTMDAAASIFNFVAIRYSLQPADEEHRFGHGKAESIAGLIQSAFIAGSAAFLWLHAISRLNDPSPLAATNIGIIVMSISLALTIALVILQKYVVKKTNSAAIEADSLHYLSDILVNIGVIAVLVFNSYLWPAADALFGFVIAIFIFYNAGIIAYKAAQSLLDHELPTEIREKIITIVESHPKVIGLHDLRTRESGSMQFIQVHIDLDKTMNLQAAHDIGDEVEALLTDALPHCDVLIHTDPA